MGIFGFGRKAVSVQAEISGQGLLEMDRTMLGYYEMWMRESGEFSDEEIKSAVRGHIGYLAGTDPNASMNYRMALNKMLAQGFSDTMRQRFVNELGRPWAPSAESEDYWNRVPAATRQSYLRQGELAFQAFVDGMNAPIADTR